MQTVKEFFWNGVTIAGFTLYAAGVFVLVTLPLTFILGDWEAAGNGSRVDLALECLGLMYLGNMLANLGRRRIEAIEAAKDEKFVLVKDVKVGDTVMTALASGLVTKIEKAGRSCDEEMLSLEIDNGRRNVYRASLDTIKRVGR